ncbi:MAG: type VI secretion system baseplate subunit TssE [Pirellula sp.]|jgi:type VI secretion system protein ImpF|nr:type VI secretion system baseplate subunit TssE [Pirellula sp.]
MSRIRTDQLLVPSLLDRLIDDEPDVSVELPKQRAQKLRELKKSVKRDLEYLLNTRVSLRFYPEDFKNVETSVLNFGIPDFSGVAMGSRKQQEILRERVEAAVVRFETRFKAVHVELVLDPDSSLQRSIRFRIDGILHAEPAPEPVVFDSILSPVVGEFVVREDGA